MKHLVILPFLTLASCDKPGVVAYEADNDKMEKDSPKKEATAPGKKSSGDLNKVISGSTGTTPKPVPVGSIKKPDEPERIIPSPTPRPVTPAGSDDESDPAAPPKIRTAVTIPGKPGFVFNPWTNDVVDVRGLPPGTLARDPQDSNPDHIFRVP